MLYLNVLQKLHINSLFSFFLQKWVLRKIVIFSLLAPPLNLTVETMPDTYKYFGNINETINCTATVAMNPTTTVLYLIGKRAQLLNEFFVAERNHSQTFLNSENKIGCYTIVKTVFSKLGYFLKNYNWVGCLANDTVSGLSSITEFRYVSVMASIA